MSKKRSRDVFLPPPRSGGGRNKHPKIKKPSFPPAQRAGGNAKRAPPAGPFTCYALSSIDHQRSYTGQTNNFERRLRQHNGEITGGARYTKTKDAWFPLFRVTQFKTLRAVLQFEVAMKKRKVPVEPVSRVRQSGSIVPPAPKARGGRRPKVEKYYTRGPKGRVTQLEYLLSLGRLNKEYDFASHGLRVLVHISRDDYLKWAGLSYEEFMHRRRVQGVEFEFL